MTKYAYFEILGFFLLLISAGWEFGIENSNDRQIASDQFEHIMIRLDEIHSRQYRLQLDLNGVAEQIYFDEKPSANFVEERKMNTPYFSGTNTLEAENDFIRLIRISLFLIGSVSLFGAKVFEHANRNGRT